MLRRGDTGAAVAEVCARLAHLGLLDSDAGDMFDDDVDMAVRTFQQERGITVDGIVGPDTYRRLDEARWQLGDRVLSYVPGHHIRGDDVAELQRRLLELGFDAGRADGSFGPLTDAALREFQRGVGVNPDGTCGPETFRAFDRLVRAVSGGSAARLRDDATLAALQTGIADKVVVIDPGQARGAEITQAIAERVEGRLAALGTQVLLTRLDPSAEASEQERAAFANRVDADLVVSICVDEVDSPLPNGASAFYYGDPRGAGMHSAPGRALADCLLDELASSEVSVANCRSHPRAWDLLRMTRMPTVRLELGYLSHAGDAAWLVDTTKQDLVAEAIANALSGFCSPARRPGAWRIVG